VGCLFTDDIMVRFVQQDTDGNTVWEAYGHFGPFDVHRQVCVLITTSTCIFGRLMCSSSSIFSSRLLFKHFTVFIWFKGPSRSVATRSRFIGI